MATEANHESTNPAQGGTGWMEVKRSVDELNSLYTGQLQELKAKAEEQGEKLQTLVEKDPVARSQFENIDQKMAEFEKRLSRPATAGAQGEDEVKAAELWAHYFGENGKAAPIETVTPQQVRQAKAAFRNFLKKGEERLGADEIKLLSTQDASQGGYLVYPEFAQEIIKDLSEMSPVRGIARVIQTASNVFKVPKRKTLPAAAWVGEGDTDALTNTTYGIEELPNGTMRATSKATREQLGDAAFNMEEQLRLDFRESFQVTEGQAFVSGDGVGKPEGFMTNTDVDASTVTGVATELSYTGMVDVAHGLNANYIANARYVMSLATLGKVRLLEDTGGNLIFLPPSQGTPSTIAGFPWTVLQDMPAVGAGTTPVAFGDFRRAYYIVERVMFDLLRDPYTAKRDGAVEFTAFMRVGGQVVLPTAIRKLTVST